MSFNVSFGSVYKVDSKNNMWEAFKDFSDLCVDKKMEDSKVKSILVDKFSSDKYNPKYEASRTMIAPDYMDESIEEYCANKGINYKKYSISDMLNGQKILDRIDDAPKGMKKVNVDVKKLEEYLKNQNSNKEHCIHDYEKFYSDDVNYMLKSGEPIPATTLTICGNGGSSDEVIDYVNKFGAKNLNDNQVGFYFEQRTEGKPDHCVYFALKNMGISHIPVYVDKDSYKIGNALGLFN